MNKFFRTVALCVLVQSAGARVVINEVMYHAPEDLEDLEYVELYNSEAAPVDIGNWSFTKGVKLRFPAGTKIPGNGFIVVARNADRLREFYKVQAAGVFAQKLSNDGERIELADANGAVVDTIAYKDEAPWPLGADGYSGSLERIDANTESDNPANWISSPLSANRTSPTGSPGKANSLVLKGFPPVVNAVKFAPDDVAPDQSVLVQASVRHSKEIREVALLYRIAAPGFEKPEVALPMSAREGGIFAASIPGQPKDQLVRFRIRATDADGNTRFYPAETEPRPALSYYVHEAYQLAKIPFGFVINTTQKEMSGANRMNRSQWGPWGRQGNKEQMPFRSAFIHFDPSTRKTQLFDFVQVNPRKGGRKVKFYSDQPFDEMTSINLIFEYDERFLLAEPLAYELYRRAGMAAEKSYHMRVWVNGQPIGYQLVVEQPNKGFLRRNKLRDDGDLYKLLWYGDGLIGQHDKRTNKRAGHKNLVALVNQLNETSDRAQWEVIRKNFEVEQVANYFAVNTALSYWDGFFNNYFTYHDVNGTGKWTMYPWDQDKTWGITDGRGRVFYDMPITFGMNGDKPPGARRAPAPGEMQFGSWWRPPGWFSGPLLANPYFRRIFLTRTKEIIETTYTEKNFHPLIDELGVRLRDEVRIRAELHGEDPAQAVQRLEGNLKYLREHLKKRREFLLAQKEIQDAGRAQ